MGGSVRDTAALGGRYHTCGCHMCPGCDQDCRQRGTDQTHASSLRCAPPLPAPDLPVPKEVSGQAAPNVSIQSDASPLIFGSF